MCVCVCARAYVEHVHKQEKCVHFQRKHPFPDTILHVHTHTHTCTYTHTSGQPTAEQNEQTKQLEEQMQSLEGRRQQLEQQQVDVIKQLRSLQTMEKQFQEAVKIQQGQPGAVVKLVLRKRYDYQDSISKLYTMYCSVYNIFLLYSELSRIN